VREALTARLRPPRDEDHSVLAELRRDEAVQHMLLAYPPPGGADDLSDWIKRRNAEHWWVIADSETDACVGYVQLSDVHRKGGHAMVGIALAERVRGTGAGSAAMRGLVAEARALGLRKIMIEVRADNAPAIALYERSGFRNVGTLKDHYDDGTCFHDTRIMELMLEP